MGPRGGVRRGEGHGSMRPAEKFKAALVEARAAWTEEEESSAVKIQDLLREVRELEALLAIPSPAADLLQKCRPFVWRALQGGKSPHVQDVEDAEALWPQIKDLGGA